MSEDTYRGDSTAKKIARAMYWLRVHGHLGDRFYSGGHLVLASRDGGDISVLLGMGVAPKNIIAVDRCEDAAQACRMAFPGINVIHGEAVDVARVMRRTLSSAFIDYCQFPNEERISECFDVMQLGVRDGGCFGMAFSRGHERGATNERRKKLQGECDEMWPDYKASLGYDQLGLRDAGNGEAGRAMLVYSQMTQMGIPMRVVNMPLQHLFYQNHEGKRGGTAMIIMLSEVIRERAGTSRKAFVGRTGKRLQTLHLASDALIRHWGTVDKPAIRDTVIAKAIASWPDPGTASFKAFHKLVVDPFGEPWLTPDWEVPSPTVPAIIVNVADMIDRRFPGAAAKVMCVPPPTLAAWRAHDTRGTYDDVKAALAAA